MFLVGVLDYEEYNNIIVKFLIKMYLFGSLNINIRYIHLSLWFFFCHDLANILSVISIILFSYKSYFLKTFNDD